MKTEEITFRNTFCPETPPCFLAGQHVAVRLTRGYWVLYLLLFTTIRTIGDSLHNSYSSLFGTIRYSLFATVSYSLFGFSKHSTQPPDFAISSFSPFLIHSKLKCFSVYLCTFSPPNLLSREFFQKPCSGSDTKDRNFPSDTGIKPRLLNQTSLAQYSSKISFCKQSKTKTNCLLAH